jgi:hypothetical protein
MSRVIRRSVLLACLLSVGRVVSAQAPAPASSAVAANPADVSSIDAIITTLYAVISGPVGQPRQWERFASIMHPQARLSPTGCPANGGACVVRTWSAAEYRQRVDSSLTAIGFREVELFKRVERYGNVAHAFSSYASFRGNETTPFSRGINSIQLLWDGSRWWVYSIFWDSERPGNPLPAEFTGSRP